MDCSNRTKEVPSFVHESDDLFYRTSRVHDAWGMFTGIQKIERRLRNEPLVIKYAFYGACYNTLEEAMAQYRKIGCKTRKYGRGK